MAQKNIIKRIISSPLVQSFLIYVSSGWIALEMTDYFINKYGLNERISDILSIILLIGLPIALFLVWYLSREKEEGEEIGQEKLTKESLTIQKDKSGSVTYSISRRQIIIPGFLMLIAISITIIFRMRHQSKIRWAREVALPDIESIANDMTSEGHQSWVAFDLATEAAKFIPDDPLLARLVQQIAWTARIETIPSTASVYLKPYSEIDAPWRFLGETPIDSVILPWGLSKIKIEKTNYRTVYDLVWNHWSFQGDSLHYSLSESGSIPKEMEFIPEASMAHIRNTLSLQLPGLEHIQYEKIGDFLMDRYEVTNREYKRFVDAGGYQNQDYWKYPFLSEGHLLSWEEARSHFMDKTGRPGPATWEIGDFPEGKGNYPVAGVSWYEAAAYAEFAGKELPTIFHWSQTALTYASSMIVPLSNFKYQGPMQVGASQAMNRFGIYDLAGNVREWCFNMTDRKGQRFIMGGGWNDAYYAFNDAFAQNSMDRSETNGFRCIKNVKSKEYNKDLKGSIIRPIRDFLKEPRVSDEVFSLYLKQYLYDKTALNADIEEIVEDEEYIREKITFDAAYGGERMMAYLFLPKNGKPPFQTVVYFPGSGAIYSRSSKQFYVNNMFTKSGRAVLYPIYKGTYERADELKTDNPSETNFYKDHVIMWIKDLRRSIDYLETRNEIDTTKLAYFGNSWGGAMGGIIPAVENRIKTHVLRVAGIWFQPCFPEVDQVHYLPRINSPVLMLNGRYDFFFPYETSQLPFYELLGTSQEHKKIYLYEQGHNVPETQLVKETLSWLDHYLGPVE